MSVIRVYFLVQKSWTAQSFESAVGALLTQLVTLRHRRRPMRCVSLMLDPHFAESLADDKLYQETPMLVDVIDYQQQPLRNSSAFQAFERARNQGCQMVAIFLHNGKKLAQLLRAADRSHNICLVHSDNDIVFGFFYSP